MGNAWDPQEGHETPWIDIARQLAGNSGVEALGKAAKTTPPGTGSVARVFHAAGAPVLLLFDEVLNFMNRHRAMADSFHAFIQNLTVATTGTTHGAALISLPRSQVEMTDWDLQWQDRITKVVRRVAKDLIANDETEISEVVRRRLFENLGSERVRKNVATAFADWSFERRAQLPTEWTAVDTATTETKAREFLRGRFEACYPFHSATLSVFQRKWQALAQYQQTRGTLAMLAQWIALASQESFSKARREPLLTIGSAPLFDAGFRSVVLGQLGESRLVAAIDADVAGAQAHARAGRRHQGAAARHPPSRRHGDPVRVVRRAKWTGGGPLREQIAERTKQRRQSPRLYPGSLVWCLKKPGRELREKVELWLTWRRIAGEVAEGTLGGDFDPADRTEIRVKVTDAEQAARDEVWADTASWSSPTCRGRAGSRPSTSALGMPAPARASVVG